MLHHLVFFHIQWWSEERVRLEFHAQQKYATAAISTRSGLAKFTVVTTCHHLQYLVSKYFLIRNLLSVLAQYLLFWHTAHIDNNTDAKTIPFASPPVKEGHTPKEHRWGAHLPFIGRWAPRWINHYVCDAWPVRRQTYSYLPNISWYSSTYPRMDGQAELTWVAGYIQR